MKKFRNQQARPKKNKLVVGREKVTTALESGRQLEKIYVQSTLQNDTIKNIRELADKAGVPIHKVPVEKLNGFNVYNHEGVVAQIASVEYQQLQDVISQVVENGQVPLFLILDGVTDIRNIGAMARSSFALGVDAIVVPEKGVGALNEDAVHTSAGALERIPVCRVKNLMDAIEELHLNGFTVFASEMTAKQTLRQCDFTVPSAIIMGGEESGILPALMKAADQQFSIPMMNDFESLNVSVATGIILYEAMMQRANER